MNWLAHFALSSEDDRERMGNWLADLFKPAALRSVEDPGIRRGLELHRLIDRETDRHPVVIGIRSSLPPELRRGGGIVLDVVWDHFLSQEFPQRFGRPLRPFVNEVLDGLDRVVALAPPGTEAVLDRMRAEDWLGGYGTTGGVERTLERIARRLSPRARPALNPSRAADFLKRQEDRLRQDFGEVWGTVATAVTRWRLACGAGRESRFLRPLAEPADPDLRA